MKAKTWWLIATMLCWIASLVTFFPPDWLFKADPIMNGLDTKFNEIYRDLAAYGIFFVALLISGNIRGADRINWGSYWYKSDIYFKFYLGILFVFLSKSLSMIVLVSSSIDSLLEISSSLFTQTVAIISFVVLVQGIIFLVKPTIIWLKMPRFD